MTTDLACNSVWFVIRFSILIVFGILVFNVLLNIYIYICLVIYISVRQIIERSIKLAK